jgi:hypothetical protein
MRHSTGKLLAIAVMASLISLGVGIASLGTPMSVWVATPATLAATTATAIVTRLVQRTQTNLRLLGKQLAVRLVTITVGPLLVILIVTVVVGASGMRPGEHLDQLLGAAATFAFKRSGVRAAQFGAIAWLVFCGPLEAWSVARETSGGPTRLQAVACLSSWALSVVLAIVWAAQYRSMLASRG